MPAKQISGRSSLIANQTTSFFLVSGFGSGAYSAKLLNGTRQRFSGFSQPRQCGEEVLRILVTGGPPVRGGAGIAHDWRGIIWKHARHRLQVADIAVQDAEEGGDRALIGSDRIEVTHRH